MNIRFSNSASLIITITSLGDLFTADTSGSVHNKLIIQFLEELERFMIENIGISIDKWLFIVDNASIHRCKQLKIILHERINFAYIPPYPPEMAPVERYFSLLKRNVIKQATGQQVNWNKEKSREILNLSMLQIQPEILEAFGELLHLNK